MQRGSRAYYHYHYKVGFYDDNDNLVKVFNNTHDICEYLNKDDTYTNRQYIKMHIYNVLRSKYHKSKLLGKWLTIKLIDVIEKEND